jgi:hypothetical protein
MNVSTPIEPKEPPPSDAYEINEVALTDIRVFKRLRPLVPPLSKRSPHLWRQKDCGIQLRCVGPRKATTSYSVGTDWKLHAN